MDHDDSARVSVMLPPAPASVVVCAVTAALVHTVASRDDGARLELRVAVFGGLECERCCGEGRDMHAPWEGECWACDGLGLVPRQPEPAVTVAVTGEEVCDGVPF